MIPPPGIVIRWYRSTGTCRRANRTPTAGGTRRCGKTGARCWPHSPCSSSASDWSWWVRTRWLNHTTDRRRPCFSSPASSASSPARTTSCTSGWRPAATEDSTSTTYRFSRNKCVCVCVENRTPAREGSTPAVRGETEFSTVRSGFRGKARVNGGRGRATPFSLVFAAVL